MAPSRSSSSKKGKGKASELDANGRPPKIKRVKEVVFDADARKEYLTGFSKRKKAKQTLRRNKAIEREKTALNQMRRQIREERKERAAQNVKMAKEMYGDAGDEDEDEDLSGSGSDSDADNDAEEEPGAAYETNEALTTVTVEPLSLSRSPTPEPLPALAGHPEAGMPPRATTTGPPQPQTSVHKKRVKNAPQARPKLTRQEKKDRATGPKKVKKKLANKMKGTRGRANK